MAAKPGWNDVEAYFIETLIQEDEALIQARESGVATTMPYAEVAPNQGKLLFLIARMIRARRVLEFGTLAAYSTIWLARAVGPRGRVITLEVEPSNATIAQRNLAAAGLADQVEVIVGPAKESADALVAAGVEPFDLLFIDADKQNNVTYLHASLQLARAGSVIVGDNVVRDGEVADPNTRDPRVSGVRAFLGAIATHPRLECTALQTVGSKGWDGFVIALVLPSK